MNKITKPNKYLSIEKTKLIRKRLREYPIKQLRDIVIKLMPLERAPFKYIIERDKSQCRFCARKEDLEVHHITPRSIGGTNHEFNLITLCKSCHMFIHCNPMTKICKSELVKKCVVKINGDTFSKNGKKWGRPELPKNAIKKVIELKMNNPELSIRDISKKVTYWDYNNNIKKISRSAIHKILQETHRGKI